MNYGWLLHYHRCGAHPVHGDRLCRGVRHACDVLADCSDQPHSLN